MGKSLFFRGCLSLSSICSFAGFWSITEEEGRISLISCSDCDNSKTAVRLYWYSVLIYNPTVSFCWSAHRVIFSAWLQLSNADLMELLCPWGITIVQSCIFVHSLLLSLSLSSLSVMIAIGEKSENTLAWSHSGVDIALDSGSKGRGFESHCDRSYLLFCPFVFYTFIVFVVSWCYEVKYSNRTLGACTVL